MNSRRIQQHYEARVRPERASYDILDWSSPEAQTRRFQVLLDALNSPRFAQAERAMSRPPLLADVGCGMTDLETYLSGHGKQTRYIGVDITPGVLFEARRRWPSRPLLLADLFAAPPVAEHAFDVSFCSGIFNLRLGNNEEFARSALPCLARLTAHCVVANFLHIRTPHKYEHCFYFDPERVAEPIRAQAAHVEVLDDYLENDFTVVAWV